MWGLCGDKSEIYKIRNLVDLGDSGGYRTLNLLIMKFFFSEDVCEEFGYNFAAAPP
jgi:hypothetical protein